MVNTDMCQRRTEVLRIGELLPPIHFFHSQISTWHGEEGPKVGMDRKAGRSIWRAEEKIHEETSLGSTGPRQKNEDRSGCIRLHYQESAIHEVWEWKVEASGISLKVFEQDWEKLQDIWQEDVGGY